MKRGGYLLTIGVLLAAAIGFATAYILRAIYDLGVVGGMAAGGVVAVFTFLIYVVFVTKAGQ